MNVKIGIKIKELRKRDNITQELLAEVLGVTNQAISKWESESGYPDIECISSVADFFNVTIDYLFDHVPKMCLKILGFSSLKVVNGYLRDIAEPDYQVICVESGENIFDCVISEQPNVIMIDICQGPVCNINDLVTLKAFEATRNIPVFILTANMNAEDKTEWFNLGAIEYNLIPFSPTVFKAKVAAQIRIANQLNR